MDNIIVDNLPKEVVNTMDIYFREGKYVIDFRITGNVKGYSLTIHFCNPPCHDNLESWSPGIINKSPAARTRDLNRRLRWKQSLVESPNQYCNVASQTKQFINAATSCQLNTEEGIVNINKHLTFDGKDEKHALGGDSACIVDNDQVLPCSKESDRKDSNAVATNDLTYDGQDEQHALGGDSAHLADNEKSLPSSEESDMMDSNSPNVFLIDMNRQNNASNGVADDNSNDTSETHSMDIHVEHKPSEVKQNILDNGRNNCYKKIVHDTRNKQSIVYGLADDIVNQVDEDIQHF